MTRAETNLPLPLDIRAAQAADHTSMAALLLACHRHYWGQRPGDTERTSRAVDHILNQPGSVTMLIGWRDDEPVGFATYTILHPAPTEAGTLFLKDLFVVPAERGRRTGETMLRHLAGLAVAQGCSRFDWTAETDNPKAIAFYQRLGASLVTEKVYFRFTGDDLASFAAGA